MHAPTITPNLRILILLALCLGFGTFLSAETPSDVLVDETPDLVVDPDISKPADEPPPDPMPDVDPPDGELPDTETPEVEEPEAELDSTVPPSFVNDLVETTDLTQEQVNQLRTSGTGWGNIKIATRLAEEIAAGSDGTLTFTDALNEVMTARASGQGFGQIAKDKNLKVGKAVRNSNQRARDAVEDPETEVDPGGEIPDADVPDVEVPDADMPDTDSAAVPRTRAPGFFGRVAKIFKRDRTERPAKVGKAERPGRVAKSERGPEKIERTARLDKPGRVEKPTRIERVGRIEKPERPVRIDKVERPQRIEKVERPQRIEKVERPPRVEKVERPPRIERPDKPGKPEKPERPGKGPRR